MKEWEEAEITGLPAKKCGIAFELHRHTGSDDEKGSWVVRTFDSSAEAFAVADKHRGERGPIHVLRVETSLVASTEAELREKSPNHDSAIVSNLGGGPESSGNPSRGTPPGPKGDHEIGETNSHRDVQGQGVHVGEEEGELHRLGGRIAEPGLSGQGTEYELYTRSDDGKEPWLVGRYDSYDEASAAAHEHRGKRGPIHIFKVEASLLPSTEAERGEKPPSQASGKANENGGSESSDGAPRDTPPGPKGVCDGNEKDSHFKVQGQGDQAGDERGPHRPEGSHTEPGAVRGGAEARPDSPVRGQTAGASSVMLDPARAYDIIESLRWGNPPRDGVREYSAGSEEFLEQVRGQHLRETPSSRGKIRFVNGSWGSGKSHFLSQVRELAYDSNYLVSTVRLSAGETPFNRFEDVFYRIVKGVSSSAMRGTDSARLDAPIAEVFRQHLFESEPARPEATIPRERYDSVSQALMQDGTIDIDFRRLVRCYWETFLPEQPDPSLLEDRRGELMQWFSGDGTVGEYRKKYGIQKLVTRSNARELLISLGQYALHAGFTGVVVLLDEAEMSYSVMRKSDLKQAHNNLIHLIDSMKDCAGLFLVYATTPDFFFSEKHGIRTYGALSQRIGQPEERPPHALDTVWNLDFAQPELEDYQAAARKIRELYIAAAPESAGLILDDSSINKKVEQLRDEHPDASTQGFWRVLAAGMVRLFDRQLRGDDEPSAKDLRNDVIEALKES